MSFTTCVKLCYGVTVQLDDKIINAIKENYNKTMQMVNRTSHFDINMLSLFIVKNGMFSSELVMNYNSDIYCDINEIFIGFNIQDLFCEKGISEWTSFVPLDIAKMKKVKTQDIKEKLSKIIDSFNDKFGGDFGNKKTPKFMVITTMTPIK